jgi:RNA polymerase sigma-70 factor (ECF subfamily)
MLVRTRGTHKAAGVAIDDQSSLITALKGRDNSAWSAAVDRHLHEVYGFVFHLVGGDRTVAEDLNQETWLEAVNGIDRCNAAQGSFRNWLFGIARKRVALHYRRRALAGNPASLNGQIEAAVELGNRSVLPEDVLEQIERLTAVRAAMLRLPDDRRQALVWKYVEGLSVKTIAVRTGRTAKAVESLLSRAREQMGNLLRWYMTPCGEGRKTSRESSHE